MHTSGKRMLMLACGSVAMLFLGLIYAWSNFVKPLEEEFGWSRSQTSFTFTVSIAFFVVGLITSGWLSQKMSKRSVMLIAAASMMAGFVLCSFASSLLALYFCYGVLVGFGVGVANNALVSTIVKWFPGRTGAASGVLMLGFGLGGMILGPTAVNLMAAWGWRTTFLWFGVVFAVIMALVSLTLKMPPAEAGSASAGGSSGTKELSGAEAMRTGSFWLFIAWFTLMMAGGLIVIGHASPYAQDLGLTVQNAAVAVGVFSLSNGIGRILTGVVFDKFGLRRSMLLTTLYLVISAAALVASEMAASVPLMFVGFVFAGLSYGGGPTTSSTFASSRFGMKHFAMNYALVSSGMIPGAILGPFLAGALRDSSGQYLTSFIAMLVFGAAGCCLWNFVVPSKK